MAPLAMGWLSCAMETLSAGRKTMAGMPRRGAAQYAASAEVCKGEGWAWI